MLGTKCPTVRSGGTTRMRSALIPILMISRASMGRPEKTYVVPANAGTHNHSRSRRVRLGPPPNATTNIGGYGSPLSRGRQERLLLRSSRALDEGLATLHLVE